jgi:hypothetical protein
MNERASQLHATADQQVGKLLDLISTLDHETSHLPCPGREKLGDGTVAASARHTADNYQRIAAFVNEPDGISAAHDSTQHPAHEISRALRILRHRRAGTAHRPGAGNGQHDAPYTADDTDLGALVEQLVTARQALARTAELSDSQLDAIPPAGGFRFCDGKRTMEQVLVSLLKHQRHQLDALKAAVS